MIQYSQCPVCASEDIKPVLHVKDYTVSQEVFSIACCQDCSLRFTQDVPDATAIAPYYKAASYISHTDTQEGLISKLYHRVRTITLRKKKKLVVAQTGKATGIMLDVGCGTGAFLHAMKDSGWGVEGLEPDAEASAIALRKYGIHTKHPSALFSLLEGSYDAITLWHVLEHVHDLQAYCAQLKKLLKPGGVLFVAVPNYTSYDAVKYNEHWAAYDVPRHLYHFSPAAMKQLMQQHGLSIRSIKPMWFDSFYVCMLSEQYKHGKNRLIPAFFHGFISNLKALFNGKRCSSLIYIITT